MERQNNDFGFIFWLHLSIITLILASPFLMGWKMILFLIFAYYLQILVLGGCILTQKQFRDKSYNTSFYHYYLTKLGFRLERKRVNIFVNGFLPWILFAAALIWQVALGRSPAFLVIYHAVTAALS